MLTQCILMKFISVKFILIKLILLKPNFIPNLTSLSLAQLSPSLFSLQSIMHNFGGTKWSVIFHDFQAFWQLPIARKIKDIKTYFKFLARESNWIARTVGGKKNKIVHRFLQKGIRLLVDYRGRGEGKASSSGRSWFFSTPLISFTALS